MKKSYFVYIMASESGTLYIGVTSDLSKRVYEHREGLVESFTKKYNCKKLIYFEQTGEIDSAIAREKQLKKWNRSRKEILIRGFNPGWIDLAEELEL